MERCLKRLVLEAEAVGFGYSERAAGIRWDPLGKKPCPEGSTGSKRLYTVNRRKVKKLIPVNYLRKKMDEGHGSKLIRTIRGVGYQLSVDK